MTKVRCVASSSREEVLRSLFTDQVPLWDQTMRKISCPVCGLSVASIGVPYVVPGQNSLTGRLAREDTTVVPVVGVCGCEWEVCLAVKQEECLLFTRILNPCEEDEWSPLSM